MYRVIDGMHRTEAVKRLVAEKELPADFTIPCVEFSAETPESVAVAYAQRNMNCTFLLFCFFAFLLFCQVH